MRLRVALAQMNPAKGTAHENVRKAVETARKAAADGAHILCLPELFPFGLLPDRQAAEEACSLSRSLLDTLRSSAEAEGIVIFAGLPWKDGGQGPFNSLFCLVPGRAPVRYDKLHLFKPFGEDRVFEPGRMPAKAVLNGPCKDFCAGMMICYDIRFPELARKYSAHGCTLMVVSALWPAARRQNFTALIRARAMENQCFVVASNACGICGTTEMAGSSLAAAPDGSVICEAGHDEGLTLADLDLERVLEARRLFNSAWPQGAWNHAFEGKVCPLHVLQEETARRKAAGQRLVFTNGCFDLLHAGHVSYLHKARSLGDFLVVGLNSDSSVRALKGASRPVNPQDHRAMVLSALSFVDYVVIFEEQTPERLIRLLEPDVLVKGADWAEKDIVGADFVKSRGGRVERIPFEMDTSTTAIMGKILLQADRRG